jgi:hypothetical protein
MTIARSSFPDVVICDYDLLVAAPLADWERDPILCEVPIIAVSLTRRPEEAGLVVTDSGKKVRNPALKAEGEELGVSGGQLEIYVYPDDAARERDLAGLDTTRKGLPSIYDPKYIISGNMIAILHTPKDRLAERVKLVLTSRHGG